MKNKIRVVFAIGKGIEEGTYAFGKGNSLPWEYIQEDFDMFRDTTEHNIVVMGHATWKSLPCKLKNRVNVVVTSALQAVEVINHKNEMPDHVIHTNDSTPSRLKQKLREVAALYNRDVNVIGGKALILTAATFADEIHMTEIKSETGYEFTTGFSKEEIETAVTQNKYLEVREVYEIYKRMLHGRARKSLDPYSPVKSVRRTIYTRKKK